MKMHVYMCRSYQMYLFEPDATAISEYGGGSGRIHYSDVFCTGNETRLVDCSCTLYI